MNQVPKIASCKIKLMKRSKEEVEWRGIFELEGQEYFLTLPVTLKNETWTAGRLQWRNDYGTWKDVNVTNHLHFKDHVFMQLLSAIKKHSKFRLQLQAYNRVTFSTAGFNPEKYGSFKVEMIE